MEMEPDYNVVVIDSGTGYLKAGYAGELIPRFFERCAVARKPISSSETAKGSPLQTQYCEEAINRSMVDSQVEKIYPIDRIYSHGSFDNSQVWSYSIEKLNINSSECTLMMGSSSTNEDKTCSEKMKWAFEEKNFKAFALVHDSIAALKSNELDSGLVLDIGESSTRLFPVHQHSGLLLSLIMKSDLSGRIATLYLREILRCTNYPSFTLDVSVIDSIKFNSSKTLINKDISPAINAKPHKLAIPNSNGKFNIFFSSELFMTSELFFNDSIFSSLMPALAFSINSKCLTHLIREFLNLCPINLRISLISHFVVTGGTCNSEFFVARLSQEIRDEIKKSYPGLENFFIISNMRIDYRITIFRGLSSIAHQIRNKPKFWITRDEYFRDPKAASEKATAHSFKQLSFY